ncbi:MAG: hypothetical protein ACTTJK_03865 [Phocaeicola sp.]|uniref:hypothetical protein n=1 Tax=Phocaeicola sp. TaxID=2773926 RepID=UPI003FA0BAF2
MKAKISIKQLLPFLLMVVMTLGVSCRKDDDVDDDMDKKYDIIDLNMDDHRFENNREIAFITNAESNHSLIRYSGRNDSIFVSYYGVLLYLTRLPADFPIYGNTFIFSGSVREKSDGTDYYPILLSEFKYELYYPNEVLNTKIK